MDSIASVLARAKHWQLFVAILVFVGAAVAAMVSSFAMGRPGKFPSIVPFLVVIELAAISLGGWLWSSGMFLNSLVPEPYKMEIGFFRFSIIYLPLYLPVFGIFFEGQNLAKNVFAILISWALIFPLHVFAMFCQIYSWYFVSKSLAMAEKPSFAAFPNYVGYFFGLWILPVGIWIIQPRINRLYANAVQPLSS